MKPHIKVIQRNGVDIFVTSSMVDKLTVSEQRIFNTPMSDLYANEVIKMQLLDGWDCTIDYGHNHPVYQGVNNSPN